MRPGHTTPILLPRARSCFPLTVPGAGCRILVLPGARMYRTALFGSALWALLRNKTRSLLTVLGITIGIAAVICVVAIGKAGQAQVEQQMNNLGDNFVWIEAGGRAVNGVRTGMRGTKSLTLADAVAIKNQIPLIKSV